MTEEQRIEWRVDRLQDAYAAGHLDLAVFEDAVSKVLAGHTFADLEMMISGYRQQSEGVWVLGGDDDVPYAQRMAWLRARQAEHQQRIDYIVERLNGG